MLSLLTQAESKTMIQFPLSKVTSSDHKFWALISVLRYTLQVFFEQVKYNTVALLRLETITNQSDCIHDHSLMRKTGTKETQVYCQAVEKGGFESLSQMSLMSIFLVRVSKLF